MPSCQFTLDFPGLSVEHMTTIAPTSARASIFIDEVIEIAARHGADGEAITDELRAQGIQEADEAMTRLARAVEAA